VTLNAEAVTRALDRVVDPCSNAMGLPLGLVEMGLVKDVEFDHAAAQVVVRLRLTSPCCSYGPLIAAAARTELQRIPGLASATVEIDHGATWTPAALTTDAARRLEQRRAATRRLTGVQPYTWDRSQSTEAPSFPPTPVPPTRGVQQ
jgi:metal-sulfur cluster biosynthetic enzyme